MRDVGFKLTNGAAATPVPLTETKRGEPAALSVTPKVALLAPPAVGVKVILNVQEAPGAFVAGSAPQLLVWLKSLVLAPVKPTALIVTLPPAPEVFVQVNACDGDDVPTVNEPKVRLAGRSVAVSPAGTVA